jgi:hypothetical protein
MSGRKNKILGTLQGGMKRGAKVYVCHDGKYGRRVQGDVVATRNGHHILVGFEHPACGYVEFWARRRTTNKQRPYTSFCGWADIE